MRAPDARPREAAFWRDRYEEREKTQKWSETPAAEASVDSFSKRKKNERAVSVAEGSLKIPQEARGLPAQTDGLEATPEERDRPLDLGRNPRASNSC